MTELQISADGLDFVEATVPVSEEVVLATINYLATRPYIEVHFLIDALRPLLSLDQREDRE